MSTDAANLYARLFDDGDATALALQDNIERCTTAYLDGKPKLRGKHKITAGQRDQDFWTCLASHEPPAELWRTELLILALARYFAQDKLSDVNLLSRIADVAPDTLCTAVRRSGLVLRAASRHRLALQSVAALRPDIEELNRVLEIFSMAHHARTEEVAKWQETLAETTPFELLILASLYAFEHLVPMGMSLPPRVDGAMSAEEGTWHAINDLLLWKLGTARPEDLRLDDATMAPSLATYLGPVLQGTPAAGHHVRSAFRALLEAQIELNEFISRSADAYSYDDGIRFVRHGEVLEIEMLDDDLRAAWDRDSRKLARLHEYWFYRAIDEFERLPLATQAIGRAENHEANRLAYLRAIRTRLRLTDVYGVAERVSTDSGDEVDLFQALLSLELTSAFFQRDFIEAFMGHYRATGNWMVALRRLAEDGLREGFQIRFPLTWSDRSAKIANITGWTVTPEAPEGNAAMAARILDFWTSDWSALASRVREGTDREPNPELFERPFLKFGPCLVQLPWLVGVQNNSTAAINNLRRLGQGRGEFRAETERIEAKLGSALAARGFSVRLNWMPDRATHGDAGEVDIICALDGHVLVLEVKSTFMRMSQRDAWFHATSTLRKAGRQLQRKIEAVTAELRGEGALATDLGFGSGAKACEVHGWIVDTSIECDHQRFAGFLKVSLEEVLVALRDDRGLLHDPEGLFRGVHAEAAGPLYPQGFTAQRFVQAVQSQTVWEGV